VSTRRVSTAGAYAVAADGPPRVSTAGVYVVHGPNQRRISTAGVYVVEQETVEPPPGDDGWSEWSAPVSYTTPSGPSKPTLNASPSTGFALLVGSAYSHSQSKAHKATEFDLGGVIVAYGTPVTQHLEEELDPSTLYTGRRVRYQDEDDEWSLWSNAISYTTADVPRPAKPVLTVPDRSDVWALLRSTAFSHVDAEISHDGVQWQVDTAAGNFSGVPLYDSDVLPVDEAGNWRDHVVEELTASTQYRARVRHRASDGLWSLWSTVVSFTTLAVQPPPAWAPTLAVTGPTEVRERYYGAMWGVPISASVEEDTIWKMSQIWTYRKNPDNSYTHIARDQWSNGGPDYVVPVFELGSYRITLRHVVEKDAKLIFTGLGILELETEVVPAVLAPRIETPTGENSINSGPIEITWAALAGYPVDSMVDLEYKREGDANWSMIGGGLAADTGLYSWSIVGLPVGIYQIRIRMKTAEETSRWRYGVPFVLGPVSSLVLADGSTLDDYETGGVLHAKDWYADPIRSAIDMSQPYYGAQIVGTHWQRYLPTLEPRDLEIVAQVQSRCWESTQWWAYQFNAMRRGGVGAALLGSNDHVWTNQPGDGHQESGMFGLWSQFYSSTSYTVPWWSTLNGAAQINWKGNVYGRGSGVTTLSGRAKNSVVGLSEIVRAGYCYEWSPEVEHDPWYQVRMRVAVVAIRANGNRDYRVRIQVAGPDQEPQGPDAWSIDKVIQNVDLDCGMAGLVAWMGSALNDDVQVRFRGLKVLPLDYGDCITIDPDPPLPLTLKTNIYCEQLTVWAINYEGIAPPSLLESDFVVHRVDTGVELYALTSNVAEWKFNPGQLPTNLQLEASVRWKDIYTGLWSDWSSTQFTIDTIPLIGKLVLVSPPSGTEVDELTEIQLVWKLEGSTTQDVTYSGWATHNNTRVNLFSGLTVTQYNLDLTRFVTGSIFIQIDAYGPCDTRTILYFVLEREAADELCWPIEEVRIGPLNTIKDLATAHIETVDKLNELIRCFNISMETIWEKLWPDVKPRK
jgi:hypothetical protein